MIDVSGLSMIQNFYVTYQRRARRSHLMLGVGAILLEVLGDSVIESGM